LDALGYASYDFYGVSYGTLLGQHVMMVAPRGLRSAILDANAPRDLNFITYTPQNAWDAMQRFFKACVADSICDADNPNLESAFLQTAEALNAQPVILNLTDPETGKSYAARFSGDEFVATLFQMLYITPLYPQIPSFLTASANGDFAWAENVLPNFIFDDTMSYGMYIAVICAEKADFSAADVKTEGVPPVVAQAFADSEEILAVCEAWKLPKLPAEANAPANSSIPTFVISGEFDPITPPSFGDQVAKALQNAFHVVYPATGHGILGIPCPAEMLAAFLADPSKQPDDSCISGMALRFPAPGGEVELEPITLGNIQTLAPKGWNNLQEGVYVSESGTSVLLFDVQDGAEVDAALRALFESALPAEPSLTIEASGLTWAIYEIDLQQVQLVVAGGAQDGKVYIVALQGTPQEIDALARNVLMPILNNFTIK
ncbi:MAG: alpha/beta fold hydrolase, partial [Aggregatilineales bacterium]